MSQSLLAIRGLPRFVLNDGVKPRCNPRNAYLFMAVRSNGQEARKRVDVARDICLSCPLQVACLKFGQQHRETGVWGGEYLSSGKVAFRARA